MIRKRYEIIVEVDQKKCYFLLDEKYNIIYKTKSFISLLNYMKWHRKLF